MHTRQSFDTVAIYKWLLRAYMFMTTYREKSPPYLPALTILVRSQMWREWGYNNIAEYLCQELMWHQQTVISAAKWAKTYDTCK
jgi:hypothetical protein